MRMDDGLGSEVEQMCNLSGYVEECGSRKGETRLAKLISLLLQKGDYDGVRLVTEDEAARREFYRQYGIIDE